MACPTSTEACVKMLTLALGLIPQAPLHTASLVMLGYDKPSSASSETTASFALGDPRLVANDNEHAVRLSDMENGHASGRSKSPSGGGLRRRLSVKMQQKETVDVAGKEEVPVAVVEQRVSNLAQGCLCEPFQAWELGIKTC